MDVKNAFVNRDLAKKVYMQPPPSYGHKPNKVCASVEHFMGSNKLFELSLSTLWPDHCTVPYAAN